MEGLEMPAGIGVTKNYFKRFILSHLDLFKSQG